MDQVIHQMNQEKIALLTDSCADLSAEQRADAPIFVLPLRIRRQDQEYADGVDVFSQNIYQWLKEGELPKTSLPDGGSVKDILDEIAAQGYEKVLAIHLSSGLSGTYNMVRLQGESRDDLEVAVFDSMNGSMGMGVTLLQAWEDIKAGMSWDELIHTRVPKLLANSFPFFSVDTLEYLQKGGRIGTITALAGTMLNIKPIIGFDSNAQLTSVAKVRGRKAVQGRILELLQKKLGGHTRYNLGVANGGAPEEAAQLEEKLKEAFPNYDHIWRGEIDATLSVYIGPGVIGACIQLLD